MFSVAHYTLIARACQSALRRACPRPHAICVRSGRMLESVAFSPPLRRSALKASDIPAVHRLLSADFAASPAPVIDLMGAQGESPFRILLATICSARTKDACTAKVCREKLFPAVKDWDDVRRLSVDKIAQLVYPVGFYRQKAEAIKKIPDVLDARFGGRLPETVEELCELPGVGRKTANLVVAVAFKKPAICVDVHVHRICNRLGLIRTKTPFETEMTLRKILPVRYWKTWNSHLVSFGQTRCAPVRPKCDGCPIRKFCTVCT